MPARVAGLEVHRGLVYSHPGARVGSTPAALNTMFSRSFVSHEAVRFCSPGEPPDSDVILSRPPLGFVDRACIFGAQPCSYGTHIWAGYETGCAGSSPIRGAPVLFSTPRCCRKLPAIKTVIL